MRPLLCDEVCLLRMFHHHRRWTSEIDEHAALSTSVENLDLLQCNTFISRETWLFLAASFMILLDLNYGFTRRRYAMQRHLFVVDRSRKQVTSFYVCFSVGRMYVSIWLRNKRIDRILRCFRHAGSTRFRTQEAKHATARNQRKVNFRVPCGTRSSRSRIVNFAKCCGTEQGRLST